MVPLTALPAIMVTTATITLPEAVPQAHSVVPLKMVLGDIIMALEGLVVPMDLLGTTALTVILTLTVAEVSSAVLVLKVVPRVVLEVLLPQGLQALAALMVRLEMITPLLLMSMEVLNFLMALLLMALPALDMDLDTEDTAHPGHHIVMDIMDRLGITALPTAR